ncbi:MAG: ABC transporter substrate-binding protein [Bacteroidota bacterium]
MSFSSPKANSGRSPLYSLLYVLVLTVSLIQLTSCGTEADASGQQAESEVPKAERIVSLSGTLTEILYALDMGDRIVGVDITSVYPEDKTAELPRLGHMSQLNTEALLALEPDLVIYEATERGAPEAITQLEQAGITISAIETDHTLDNPINVTSQLTELLDIEESSIANLRQRLNGEREALNGIIESAESSPRVLFIYARGMGRLLAAGNETSASAMIELAGGTNAITSFPQFEALTPEALVEAQPDVVLMFTSGLASLDGKEGLQQIPGMSATPAYQNDRIITMEGLYLTGFGPRSTQAAIELSESLHQVEIEAEEG